MLDEQGAFGYKTRPIRVPLGESREIRQAEAVGCWQLTQTLDFPEDSPVALVFVRVLAG